MRSVNRRTADQAIVVLHSILSVCLTNGDSPKIKKAQDAHPFKIAADGEDSRSIHSSLNLRECHGLARGRPLGEHDFMFSVDQWFVKSQITEALILARGDGIAIEKAIPAHSVKLTTEEPPKGIRMLTANSPSASQKPIASLLLHSVFQMPGLETDPKSGADDSSVGVLYFGF
jgi:hypothetical protein